MEKKQNKKGVTAHASELTRLRRARGQLDGVERMILDKRYCVDILHQLRAAQSALRAIEASILKTHLEGCVREAFRSRDMADASKKLEEITELLNRRSP